jgi:hypothetical protein
MTAPGVVRAGLMPAREFLFASQGHLRQTWPRRECLRDQEITRSRPRDEVSRMSLVKLFH